MKDRRKKIAHSRALAKEKELSAKKSKGLKSRIVGAGAALLAIVSYLSAGDKLSDLTREWGKTIQQGIISVGISSDLIRDRIISSFVDNNFGGDVCSVVSGPIDLAKDGRSTDLIVVMRPVVEDLGCEEILNSNLVVLRNNGWQWFAIEMIPPPTSSVQYRWKNGYIFGEVFGTDFPRFSVFALANGAIKKIHSDFGELPSLDEIFAFDDRYKVLISGREGYVSIKFDRASSMHSVNRIERERHDWSALHVLSSVSTGGWKETYSFDGEPLNEDEERGLFHRYLEENEIVFVPKHCDTAHLSATPSFPGYFRPNGTGQPRACCPVDVEEYGACDEDQVDGDKDAFVIELH